jgi:hypothetical protein
MTREEGILDVKEERLRESWQKKLEREWRGGD